MHLSQFRRQEQFQPTPPRGERRPGGKKSIGLYFSISTHAPARGATLTGMMLPALTPNFNPRPREGSDRINCLCCVDGRISTHAPARGATHWGKKSKEDVPISTHAPARGATMLQRAVEDNLVVFQPTPPRGERLQK